MGHVTAGTITSSPLCSRPQMGLNNDEIKSRFAEDPELTMTAYFCQCTQQTLFKLFDSLSIKFTKKSHNSHGCRISSSPKVGLTAEHYSEDRFYI